MDSNLVLLPVPRGVVDHHRLGALFGEADHLQLPRAQILDLLVDDESDLGVLGLQLGRRVPFDLDLRDGALVALVRLAHLAHVEVLDGELLLAVQVARQR